MVRKVIAFWLSLAMVLGFVVIVDVIIDFTPKVCATTLYVNTTGSDGAYTKIQDAINASNNGGTVYVYNGTYFENVVVNKSINLTGEDRNTTIINGSGSGDVVRITADWVNITGFTVTGSGGFEGDAGIEIKNVHNSHITNNFALNNCYGIYLYYSNGSTIINNTANSNNGFGIRLYFSSGDNVTGNNVSNNGFGIGFVSSSNNNITSNNISDNGCGVHLYSSSDNNITNNNFVNNGVFIDGTQLSHFNSHNMPTNNMVNGKPLHYYRDYNGIIIDGVIVGPIGQLIITNCTDVDVKNLQINNTDIGIGVAYSTNISTTNNNVSFNTYGIFLHSSSNTNIIGNNILNNNIGIRFYSSSDNNITGNTVLNNARGIKIDSSSNNTITDNNVSLNTWIGISLLSSSNNNITGNTVSLNDEDGIRISGGSSNNNITGNTVSLNDYDGIWISDGSSNNSIIGNTIFLNNGNGIYLWFSENNKFHHNNIIYNGKQSSVLLSAGTVWDDGNGEGNYWSDYTGVDNGNDSRTAGDGVGDTEIPHPENDQGNGYYKLDNYPLINPVGNYIFLHEGWNLISIPFIQLNTNLSNVLNSINGSYDSVQWYDISDTSDPWKHNSTKKPSHLNDLDRIEHTMGFWIYIIEPGGVLFQYPGTQPMENQTINVHPGWNLIGYPSLTSYNRTVGLNNLTFGTHVDSIWTYNAATQKWEVVGELDYFELGRGYWVHSLVEKTWELPL